MGVPKGDLEQANIREHPYKMGNVDSHLELQGFLLSVQAQPLTADAAVAAGTEVDNRQHLLPATSC